MGGPFSKRIGCSNQKNWLVVPNHFKNMNINVGWPGVEDEAGKARKRMDEGEDGSGRRMENGRGRRESGRWFDEKWAPWCGWSTGFDGTLMRWKIEGFCFVWIHTWPDLAWPVPAPCLGSPCPALPCLTLPFLTIFLWSRRNLQETVKNFLLACARACLHWPKPGNCTKTQLCKPVLWLEKLRVQGAAVDRLFIVYLIPQAWDSTLHLPWILSWFLVRDCKPLTSPPQSVNLPIKSPQLLSGKWRSAPMFNSKGFLIAGRRASGAACGAAAEWCALLEHAERVKTSLLTDLERALCPFPN